MVLPSENSRTVKPHLSIYLSIQLYTCGSQKIIQKKLKCKWTNNMTTVSQYCVYVSVGALWINTICHSIPSQEWVGMNYDLLLIQDRMYFILVPMMRIWHQKLSVLHFLSKFWMPEAQLSGQWKAMPHPSRRCCYSEIYSCGFSETEIVLYWWFVFHYLFSLYLSLSLSYLSLSQMNSHYHGIMSLHVKLSHGTWFCVLLRVCVTTNWFR